MNPGEKKQNHNLQMSFNHKYAVLNWMKKIGEQQASHHSNLIFIAKSYQSGLVEQNQLKNG